MGFARDGHISVNFFDNFSHGWLLANILMNKAVLRKCLQAGFVDKGVLFPTDAGTP
ncbi:hypothetical protein IHE33_14695 (plasmid) [Mycetohabitans endofungorum]